MKTKSAIWLLLLLIGFIAIRATFLAWHYTLPDDPERAWEEVQQAHRELRYPADWQTRAPTPEEVAEFQKQFCAKTVRYVGKAHEFIKRFPKSENVNEARIFVVYALADAVAAGDTHAEKQAAAFVAAVLANKSIPEDDRVMVLLNSCRVAFTKKVGMRLFTENFSKLVEELENAGVETDRVALKRFPTNPLTYRFFLATAQRATGERQKALALEILNAPKAPPAVKNLANHILKGTEPYQVGKPLDIRFTALDGRKVDLAKLTGKVVLVEFWSTRCGPCIGEMPKVKAAYEKFHSRGFEVLAISLDDKETALRRFIKENDLPWPQHFDGKGSDNQFALQYGIFSIPTMWLVDKRGNLRDTDARRDLEGQVELLLAE